jgi:hydroxyacylglutathione hydrolase
MRKTQSNRFWSVFVFLGLVAFGFIGMLGAVRPVAAAPGVLPQQMTRESSTQADTSDVTVHTINMIASNAYLLETPEGLILVDAGIPFTERLVYRKMRQIGRDDLKLIYITHAHIDHYGAANAIREETGAPIAIHKDDAETMALGRTELGTVRDWKKTSDATLPYIEPLLRVTPTEADILLEDGDSLEEYGINAYVMHTPGHTPGSTTLIVNDSLAFVGDLLATGPKVHAQRSFAQDWLEVARSLNRLRLAEPELIYAGHGSDPISLEQLHEVDANFVDP